MAEFSAAAARTIEDVARRHGFSPDAVATMLRAVRAGHGGMAQFNHAEFGGSGQWMRGGMTMVGNMFDSALKARVERLCDELSQIVEREPPIAAEERAGRGGWWPPELGVPNSAGSQNEMRYAYFAAARRLAIDLGGSVTIYDTLDHRIGGVAQQQAGHGTLAFTSQHGVVDLGGLPRVSPDPRAQPSPVPGHRAQSSPEPGDPVQPSPEPGQRAVPSPPAAVRAPETAPGHDVVGTIEKLAELHRKGILTDAEFSAKKTELLGRL